MAREAYPGQLAPWKPWRAVARGHDAQPTAADLEKARAVMEAVERIMADSKARLSSFGLVDDASLRAAQAQAAIEKVVRAGLLKAEPPNCRCVLPPFGFRGSLQVRDSVAMFTDGGCSAAPSDEYDELRLALMAAGLSNAQSFLVCYEEFRRC